MVYPLKAHTVSKTNKLLLYLADLTHTGPVISSNVHPFGIGLIAVYLLKLFPNEIEIELFKYPHDLSAALEHRTPHIVGFSNYSWNMNLSYEYAKRIKKKLPETVIVFGGPNYTMSMDYIVKFWEKYPLIDFYIVREGELAMAEFVRTLISFNMDIIHLKKSGTEMPNCHYSFNDKIVRGTVLPRIDLIDIPSPYLFGVMDKFFDHLLIPMIHTTRGCPFSCTYCIEGDNYYQKVRHKMDLEKELEYIAQRIVGRAELFITDANFGMYKEDLNKAEIIARIQKKYGYPDYIHVSSGKNNKDRIINVSKIVGGAMRSVAVALQSTDADVLKSVNRSNISLNSLIGVAQKAFEANSDTYTEIILALPEDSIKKHTKSVRDVVELDLGIIRLYQLIMLPETEMNTHATRTKYGIKTKHRIMPRSFAKYELFNEVFPAAETEEICIGTNTLSFDDYIHCRELDLLIEILHNGRTFQELQGLCDWIGVSWFDFILRIFEKRRSLDMAITNLFDEYKDINIKRLWDTDEQVVEYVTQNIDKFLALHEGTNEMARAKSIVFFKLLGTLTELLYSEMEGMLEEIGRLDELMRLYLNDLKQSSLLRKTELLNYDAVYNYKSNFDLIDIMNHKYVINPSDFLLQKPLNYVIAHSGTQKEMIKAYLSEYGDSIDGLSRIIMFRVHYKLLFREINLM